MQLTKCGGDGISIDETDEGPAEAEPSTTTATATGTTTDDATSATTATAAAASAGTADEATNASILANKVDALINNKLPECITKQKCDEFCVSFCYVNSKSARKKLIAALSRLPRFRMELAPFYARIIASLGRLFPDIVEPILEALRREFFGILKARRQVHVDGKVRNVRYQAELVKFRVAPPIVAFRMMRALLLDLTPHHIDMLVAVMETCGRFLFLIPVTHALMQETLDTMMRLRRARPLDLHQQTLLESAYFAVKPPEKMNKGQKKKELTMVQKYARYLIQEKLEQPRVSVEEVIKHLRRLPWQSTGNDDDTNSAEYNEQVAYHVMKAVLKVARTKYVALPRVADCLSGLAKYHAVVNVMVVDRIFEELQRALESPFKREIQRILGLTRLLGELYNFTAIPAVVIFECLYHVLRFGHEVPLSTVQQSTFVADVTASTTTTTNATAAAAAGAAAGAGAGAGAVSSASMGMFYDPRIPCEADPPTDLFRAQIICELLNTTGVYFVRGAAREKLNRFLAYFQRYLLTKQMIPMHVEFTILDCFDALDNLAKEAAMDALQKSLLAQQQQQQANGKKSKKDGRHTAKKMIVPVVTEWMVHGYQFTRFDTFEAAHQAVEAYEGRLVVIPPTVTTAVDADGGNGGDGGDGGPTAADLAVNSSTTAAEEAPVTQASGPDGGNIVKDTGATTAATASSSAKSIHRGDSNDDDDSSAGGGSLDEDAELDDSDDDEDDEDDDVDDDEEDDDDDLDDDDDEDDDDDDDDDEDSDDDLDDLDDDEDDDDDDEEEEEEDDEEEDDDEDDEEGGMSEDEAARALEKMRIAEEDDEFDRAFKSVLQESRAAVVAKSINVDKMAIPAILPKPKNVYTAQPSAMITGDDGASLIAAAATTAAAASTATSESVSMGVAAPPAPPRNQVAFKLLSRDNKGRIEARQLFVPKEHAIVQHMIKSEEELRIQKERVMERTLLLSAKNAENEEYQAASASNTSDYFFGQREVYQGPSASSQSAGQGGSSSASTAQQASSDDRGGHGGHGAGTSGSSSRVNRSRLGYRSYEESKRAATTLDLDGFLAESNKAEMRRIGNRKNA